MSWHRRRRAALECCRAWWYLAFAWNAGCAGGCWGLEVRELPDGRNVSAIPGRAQHHFVHRQPLRQQRDVEDQVGAVLRLHHAGALLGADRVRTLIEDRDRHLTGRNTHERMPLTHSCMLIEWLIATTPCLAAV